MRRPSSLLNAKNFNPLELIFSPKFRPEQNIFYVIHLMIAPWVPHPHRIVIYAARSTLWRGTIQFDGQQVVSIEASTQQHRKWTNDQQPYKGP